MDGTASEIVLYPNGMCNFCHIAQKELRGINWEKNNLYYQGGFGFLKSKGKYDCLIGLSGGVDSSTVLHYAVTKLGLRPLCFTMDNGYNDPKADENILRLVESLKVPLYRYVLNINRYEEVRAAYLKAGVVNVEAVYDHLLMAASYEMASQYGIKWIISGGNVATESIMPESWSFPARDLTNIKDIYKKMTGKNLKGEKGSFPLCGLLKWNWYKWVKGIKVFYLLDYLNYNRQESEKMLMEKYGFKSTNEKHEENRFTKWYQSFYLFTKHGIDKRKAHYSSLINAGQMTRAEAIEKLKTPPTYEAIPIDERKVMSYKKRSHYDFKTDKWYDRISRVIRFFRNAKRSFQT